MNIHSVVFSPEKVLEAVFVSEFMFVTYSLKNLIVWNIEGDQTIMLINLEE